MGPSNMAKRIRAPASDSRSPSPWVDTGRKISTTELLSESRANQLKELLQTLLDTFDEAPQTLLTFCGKIKLHPDPLLVKYMDALCRDTRLDHCIFLENEFTQVFPIKFSSNITGLIAITRARTGEHILREARILADRCERAIKAVARLKGHWIGIRDVLAERAKIDNALDPSQKPKDNSIYAATNGLIEHILLMIEHTEHLESVLRRLKEFWEDYLQHLGPINLEQDTLQVESWKMSPLFGRGSTLCADTCKQLRFSYPPIFLPITSTLKYP